MTAVFEQLEKILKSKRSDKAARYVALDVVRQHLRAAKGLNIPAPASGLRRSTRAAFAAEQSQIPLLLPYSVYSPVSRGQATVVNFDALPYHQREVVNGLIRQGKKIPAIKELRNFAKCGLKEAKDTVELHPSLLAITPR